VEKIKESLPNKNELEINAKNAVIKTRDALFGGRTEAFKSYHKCTESQKYIIMTLLVYTQPLMP
jgi:hypothetical protein